MFLVISFGLAKLSSSVGVENDVVAVVDSGIVASRCDNCTQANLTTVVQAPVVVSDEQKEADRLANESMGYVTTFLVGLIPALLEVFLRWLFSTLFGIVQRMKSKSTHHIGTHSNHRAVVASSRCTAFRQCATEAIWTWHWPCRRCSHACC
eukprot:COSAG01_NODE_19929_length_981_cov_1.044218_2_plen_151_part_00